MIEDWARSDVELLAATPADPDAFTTFYRRHVRGLWALVVREAARDDVGDVVAEVFATALVHRRRFDPQRGSAAAWLAGIARHKIIDARRRGSAEAQMCRRLGIRLPAEAADDPEPDHGMEVRWRRSRRTSAGSSRPVYSRTSHTPRSRRRSRSRSRWRANA